MKAIIESINLVLAEWDPIGVGENLASDEYRKHIPLIIKCSENRSKLMNCLEDITNEMEIGYDSKNIIHLEDLQQVCNRIIQIVQRPI
jgi:hypothetical protein